MEYEILSKNLAFWDWIIIVAYFLPVLGMGLYSRLRKRQNTEEYLVAHHSMHWFVVALAVFATLFSTISFVAIPGEAYNYGLMMMSVSLGQIIFTPLAIWLFLRFFFRTPAFTVYEYLELRFDRRCRVIAAGMFTVIRLFYTGGVFYAAAIIFESLAGWSPLLIITIVGGLTVLYTLFGGIRAVIMADVLQSVIIFIGIMVILTALLWLTGFDITGVIQFAHRHSRTFELYTNAEFYRLNVHDRWNFWLMGITIFFLPMISLSCDQMVIQRLLSGKDYRQAVRSVYMNYLLSIPVVMMLFGIGLLLFYFYNQGGGSLPPGIRGDQVLGYFVNTQLPSPFPGLIITALLAALMSTVAGAVNSLVTVVMKDMLVLWQPGLSGTAREVSYCRFMTLIGGLAAMGVAAAMYLLGQEVSTTVQEVIAVWACLWPILFSAFFYGVISGRVSAQAMLVSLAISGAVGLIFPYLVYYALPAPQRWGFQWVGLPGQFLALALPPLLTWVWPNRKNVDGLTVTRTSKSEKMS